MSNESIQHSIVPEHGSMAPREYIPKEPEPIVEEKEESHEAPQSFEEKITEHPFNDETRYQHFSEENIPEDKVEE